jgi:hypothetical protein
MLKKQALQAQGKKLLRTVPASFPQKDMQIVVSALYHIALKLEHSQYFIVSDAQGRWQTITLEHRHAPEQEKTVIYAFGDRTLANIERLQHEDSDRLLCQSYPVMELLLQFLGLRKVDSLVFFEHITAPNHGKEIKRLDLENAIQQARISFAQTQVC